MIKILENRSRAFKIVSAALLALIILTFIFKEKEPYDIKVPTNGHHAVIQIIDSNSGGTCSAFVIDDRHAFTAGHCMNIANNTMKYIQKDIEKIRSYMSQLQIIMIMHKQQCSVESDERCALIFAQMSAVMQALNEKLKYLLSLKPTEYSVVNSEGFKTNIKAVASYKEYGRRDFGVIEGDFRNFKKLPIMRKGFTVKKGDLLRACGFPGGAVPAVCTDVVAESPYVLSYGDSVEFSYRVVGLVVPGNSGGPVLDKDGVVIGVVSAGDKEFSYITPLMGLQDRK